MLATLMIASLAINHNQPHVLNNLGGVFYAKASLAMRVTASRRQSRSAPVTKQALRNLAIAFRGSGDLDRAENAARDALAIDPISDQPSRP